MKAHTFLRRRYRIVEVPNLGEHRHADIEDPGEPNKAIRIRRGLSDRDRLAALLDEGIHACFWSLDNDEVDRAATDLAKFLWRDGWRRMG